MDLEIYNAFVGWLVQPMLGNSIIVFPSLSQFSDVGLFWDLDSRLKIRHLITIQMLGGQRFR